MKISCKSVFFGAILFGSQLAVLAVPEDSAKKNELNADLTTAKEKLDEVQAKLDAKNPAPDAAQKVTLGETKTVLSSQIQKLEDEVAAIVIKEQTLETVDAGMVAVETELADAVTRKETLESEIKTLTEPGDVTAKNAEIDKAKNDIKAAQQSLDLLVKQKGDLEKELKGTPPPEPTDEDKLATAEARVKQIAKELNNKPAPTADKKTELKKEKNKLEAEITDLKKKIAEAKKDTLDAKKKELKTVEAELKEVTDANGDDTKRIAYLKEQQKSAKAGGSEAKAIDDALDGDEAKRKTYLEDKKTKLEAKKTTLDNEIKKLKKDADGGNKGYTFMGLTLTKTKWIIAGVIEHLVLVILVGLVVYCICGRQDDGSDEEEESQDGSSDEEREPISARSPKSKNDAPSSSSADNQV